MQNTSHKRNEKDVKSRGGKFPIEEKTFSMQFSKLPQIPEKLSVVKKGGSFPTIVLQLSN